MNFHYKSEQPCPQDYGHAVVQHVREAVIPMCHFAAEQGFEVVFDDFGWTCVKGRVLGSKANAVALRLRFPRMEYLFEECQCHVTG